MAVHSLLILDVVVSAAVVGTQDDASIAVLGDVLVDVLEILTHQKPNSSVATTDECRDWRFVSLEVSSPLFESALARALVFVLKSFLSSRHVDLVSLTNVVEVEFVNLRAHDLDFVDEVEDSLIVAIKIPSVLNGRLRSHLLEDVEHLFEPEAMLAEDRVRKAVEVRLAVFAPVLLSVFTPSYAHLDRS
jgi:hypothetical protein